MTEPVYVDSPDEATRDHLEKWLTGCAAAYGIAGRELSAFVAAVANDVSTFLARKDAEIASWRACAARLEMERKAVRDQLSSLPSGDAR